MSDHLSSCVNSVVLREKSLNRPKRGTWEWICSRQTVLTLKTRQEKAERTQTHKLPFCAALSEKQNEKNPY